MMCDVKSQDACVLAKQASAHTCRRWLLFYNAICPYTHILQLFPSVKRKSLRTASYTSHVIILLLVIMKNKKAACYGASSYYYS